MAFRDETDALRSQRDALEKQRDALEDKIDALTSSPLEREHLDLDTRLRAAERDIHQLRIQSNKLQTRYGVLLVAAFACLVMLGIAAIAVTTGIALERSAPEPVVSAPAPPRRPTPPAHPDPPSAPEPPPPPIEPPRPPDPPPEPARPPSVYERSDLEWAARVQSSDHPAVRRGQRCRISAHVLIDHTQFRLLDWNARVECGDTVVYDTSMPFNGSSSSGATLAFHAATADRPETVDLSARDVGDRTGRPQLYVDTQARAARIVFSDVIATEVRLTVAPGATPTWVLDE